MPAVTTESQPDIIDRDLGLELVRVTETAAIAAGQWVGMGDTNATDGAAVDAMRSFLSTVRFIGTVVIGEGGEGRSPDVVRTTTRKTREMMAALKHEATAQSGVGSRHDVGNVRGST